MPSDKPLVSVITIVYNGAACIEKTIQSVIAQTYSNIEYIIVDGGSNDGTIDIIKKYETHITKWISEPDEGISDAFNKGIAMVSGEFVQIVNADDWLSNDQIEKAVSAIMETDYGYVFGDMVMYDQDGNSVYLQKGDPDYESKIRYSMPMLNHPTVMARKDVYDKVGGFDKKYRIAMDYDWLLRVYLAGFKGLYSDKVIGNMRLCGVSTVNFKKTFKEGMDVTIANGGISFIAFLMYYRNLLRRIIRLSVEFLCPKDFALSFRKILNPTLKGLDEKLDSRK